MGKSETPNYLYWMARDIWKDFEAACLINGLDPKYVEVDYRRLLTFPRGFEIAKETLEIIKTWTKNDKANVMFETWHPLKYINKYLLVVGKKVPKKLLILATERFLSAYNADELKDITEFAEPFKGLTDSVVHTTAFLDTENFVPINDFLQQQSMTKAELFNKAAKGGAELFLNLENIEGSIGGEKEFIKAIEVTGICRLTSDQCKKALLNNEFDYVYLKRPIFLCDGYYSKRNNNGWEKVKVTPNTLQSNSLLFGPRLYEEKNKDKVINPCFCLKPCFKQLSEIVYCCSLPIEKILVLQRQSGLFAEAIEKIGCLDKANDNAENTTASPYHSAKHLFSHDNYQKVDGAQTIEPITLSRKSIRENFATSTKKAVEDRKEKGKNKAINWKYFFDNEKKNGLCEARVKKMNSKKVAYYDLTSLIKWLVCEGHYTIEHITALIKPFLETLQINNEQQHKLLKHWESMKL